jgi:glycosyl transferase family 25
MFTKGEAEIKNADNQLANIMIPPIFVLNLDRSVDRWKLASEQMSLAGLTVERLPAVDGRQLSKEELRNKSTRIATYLQPRGVIGCYLSHRKFWQLVVDRNLDAAIIFEDDVKLVSNFKNMLIGHLESLGDEEYDVILLGAIGRVHPRGKDGFGTRLFSFLIGGNRPLKRINNNLFQPSRPAVSCQIFLSLVFYIFCYHVFQLNLDDLSGPYHYEPLIKTSYQPLPALSNQPDYRVYNCL